MDKVVVISGGSDGIGYEIAKMLSKNNKVIILAKNKEKTEKASKTLACDYFVCDVSDYSAIAKAVEQITKKYKRVDCLVNNAGIWIEGPIDTNDPEQISSVINVNTLGTIYLTRAIVPQMKKQKEGIIINIISQAGIYASSERSVYSASKFAITGFTKSILPELSKFGIRVTGIYPGKMNTKLFEKVGIKKQMNNALEPSEIAKAVDFILSLDKKTVIPELGIKNIEN